MVPKKQWLDKAKVKQLDLYAAEEPKTPFGVIAKLFAVSLRTMAGRRGHRTSNTVASKCEETSDDVRLFESLPQGGGGIDYLSCSIYGTFASLDSMREQLTDCQNAARAGEKGRSLFFKRGLVFQVAATGGGRGIAHHPYRVECDGISLIFGARSKGDSGCPLMMVQVSGEPFLLRGEVWVFERIEKILGVLGVQVKRVAVSRIDGCVDLPHVSIDEVWDPIAANNFFGRARVFTWCGTDGGRETIGLQSRSMMLRCYEKSKECKDPQKRAAMIQNRWGCDPERALRVEFEVHRECLVDQMELTDFAAVLKQLGKLFQWAVMGWCRLVEKCSSRSTDSPIAPIWERVACAFDYWCGKLEERTPAKVPPIDPQRLLDQLFGCLTSAFAALNVRPENWEECLDVLKEFTPNTDVNGIVLDKIGCLVAEGRLDVGSGIS